MIEKPLLIAIEGIDGCGKGTQTEHLARLLNAWTLHFPNYDTPIGKLIKRMLTGEVLAGSGRMFGIQPETRATALILQSLMLTNRHEIMGTIMSALSKRSVVLDRYHISGLVYGEYDGLDHDWLWDVHDTLPKPDLCILLDIDAAESFRRRPERQDADEANRDRIEKVSGLYRKLWNERPEMTSWQGTPTRWVHIDGSESPDHVSDLIENIVKEHRAWVTAMQKGGR